MTIDSCIGRIDRYLKKDTREPILVDVQNNSDLDTLILHFNVGNNKVVRASDLCAGDSVPQMDALTDCIRKEEGTLLLRGFTPFFLLEGEESAEKKLNILLSQPLKGHAVFFTWQCSDVLRSLMQADPRLKERICLLDGRKTAQPKFVFVSDALADGVEDAANGISRIGELVESGEFGTLYIKTAARKRDYPAALYSLEEWSRAFDVLLRRDPSTARLSCAMGTDEQWAYALDTMKSGWEELIGSSFGTVSGLELALSSYRSFPENKRWLLFIGLKLYGAGGSRYLQKAVQASLSMEDVVHHLYRDILDVQPNDPEFEEAYEQRKRYLSALGNPMEEAAQFCDMVCSREQQALEYLTDSTQKERELVFQLLDRYGLDYDRDVLLGILNRVYPDLYAYLQPYHFKSELLNSYFREYKFQKVMNRIFPEFVEQVEEQASRRDYFAILSPRSAELSHIRTDGAQAFFVDAMGVEFLGYIMELCHSMELTGRVTVCRCELPSITSRNKEFLDEFASKGVSVSSVKTLDEIKHQGKDDYDYQRTKLPIHLDGELTAIRELLQKIKSSLLSHSYEKAILISDHGASRLAVIQESENRWAMSSPGIHSGRCCPKSELDERPEFAVDADDFWALANYDRFAGGRRASVEVHGGATLEEVVVPIIEITVKSGEVEGALMPLNGIYGEKPVIRVSYKNKAAIRLFLSQEMDNVTAMVNGAEYEAVPMGNNFYRVDMPALKKAGEYVMDVYSCGNKILTGLVFTIEKESGRTNDIL